MNLVWTFFSCFVICVAILASSSANAVALFGNVNDLLKRVVETASTSVVSATKHTFSSSSSSSSNRDATSLDNKNKKKATTLAGDVLWHTVPIDDLTTTGTYTFTTSFTLSRHTYHAFRVDLNSTSSSSSSGAPVNVDIVVNLERTAICEEDIFANMSLLSEAPGLMPWTAPKPAPPSLNDLYHALAIVPVTKTMQCQSIHDVQRSFQNVEPGNGQDVFVLIQSLSRSNSSDNSSAVATTTATTTTAAPSQNNNNNASSSSRCRVNIFVRVQRSSVWQLEIGAVLVTLGAVVCAVPFVAFTYVWWRARTAVANGGLQPATTGDRIAAGNRDGFLFLWHIQRRLGYAEISMFVPSIVFYFLVKWAVRGATAVAEYSRNQHKRMQKMKRKHNKKKNKRGDAADDDDELSCCDGFIFCCCPWCGGHGGDSEASAPCCCWCCGKKSKPPARAGDQQEHAAGSSPNPSMMDLSEQQPSSVPAAAAAAATTENDENENDEEDEVLCRICCDDDSEEELIKPCNCTDGQVHLSCLDKWRTTTQNQHAARSKCEVCHAIYRVPISRMVLCRVMCLRALHLVVFLVSAYLVLVGSFGVEALVAPLACAAPFEKAFVGPLSEISVFVLGGFTYLLVTVMAFVAVQLSWMVHFNTPIQQEVLREYARAVPGHHHDDDEEAAAEIDDDDHQEENNNNNNDDDDVGDDGEPRVVAVGAAAEHDDDDAAEESRALLRHSDETTPTTDSPQPAAAAAAAAGATEAVVQQEQAEQEQEEEEDPLVALNSDPRRISIVLDMIRLDRVQDVRSFNASRAARAWFLIFLLWQFISIVFICLLYKFWAYQYAQSIMWSWSVPFSVMILMTPVLMTAVLLLVAVHNCVAYALGWGGAAGRGRLTGTNNGFMAGEAHWPDDDDEEDDGQEREENRERPAQQQEPQVVAN